LAQSAAAIIRKADRTPVRSAASRTRKDEKVATARLSGFRVQEVSLVDLAANLRRFVVIKAAGGDIRKDISPDDYETVADCIEDGNDPEECEEVIEMAQWSTELIDNLPDSAFLYVEPGGKKDETGKTTPRSLRHLPVRGADGKVDLPHVRDALGRIPQSNLPQGVKERVMSEAQQMLSDNGGTPAAKADGDMPPPAPPPAPPPDPNAPPSNTAAPTDTPQISLPTAAREGLLTALGTLLEGLTTIAEMVNGATIDESATIPPELQQALGQTEEVFDGLVAQYAPGADTDDAPPADPNAPPPATADTSAPPEQKASDGSPSDQIAMAASVVAKAAAAVAVSKAGRKMASGRLSMLKQAYDILSGLLKELMDESMGEDQPQAAGQQQGTPPPAPQPPPPPAPPPAQKNASAPVAKAGTPVTSERVDHLIVLLEKALGPKPADPEVVELKKAMETQAAELASTKAELAKVSKATGTPNAGSVEGEAPPAPKKPTVWEPDLAPKAAERLHQNRSAANGAKQQ
jgi:hypothetical protein